MRNRNKKGSGMIIFLLSILVGTLLLSAPNLSQAKVYEVTNDGHQEQVAIDISATSSNPLGTTSRLWDTADLGIAPDNCQASVDQLPVFYPGDPITIQTNPLTYSDCNNFRFGLSDLKTWHMDSENQLGELGSSIKYYASADCGDDGSPRIHSLGYEAEIYGEYIRGDSLGKRANTGLIHEDFCYVSECRAPNEVFQCVVSNNIFQINDSIARAACKEPNGVGNSASLSNNAMGASNFAGDSKVYKRGQSSSDISDSDFCGDDFSAVMHPDDQNEPYYSTDTEKLAEAISDDIDDVSKDNSRIYKWNCKAGNLTNINGTSVSAGTNVTCYATVITDNQTNPQSLPQSPQCAQVDVSNPATSCDQWCVVGTPIFDTQVSGFESNGCSTASLTDGDTVSWECENDGSTTDCGEYSHEILIDGFEAF